MTVCILHNSSYSPCVLIIAWRWPLTTPLACLPARQITRVCFTLSSLCIYYKPPPQTHKTNHQIHIPNFNRNLWNGSLQITFEMDQWSEATCPLVLRPFTDRALCFHVIYLACPSFYVCWVNFCLARTFPCGILIAVVRVGGYEKRRCIRDLVLQISCRVVVN